MTSKTDQCLPIERRQAARIALRLPVRATIHPPPGNESETARICHLLIQDLSGVGVSVVYATPLVSGQRITLEMPDRPRDAVVCRIANMNDGHYLSGCTWCD
jgi:PilZ domain-containing protein